MQCSCTTLFIFALSLSGSLLCCIAGYFALEGTYKLLDTYGPEKNFGNPAKDDPPEYWINPETGKWEARNYNKRGNFFPQVFDGIKIYLIVLANVMSFNCFLFLVVASRSKKVVNNRAYHGKRNSLSCIGCAGWLTGYSVFLVALWLLMAGFAVLPLVEYVITRQRCWDLENPNFSPGTRQQICIDLVQYGLVFFKEGPDNGYGLICGPGGSYDPERGNLEGLCAAYYPNFCLYLAAFVGACVALLGMVLFAMRFVSIFIYLKIRRYENPEGPPHGVQRQTIGSPADYQYYPENSVANPNYEQNVLLNSRRPDQGDGNSYSVPPSAPSGFTEFNRKYEGRSNGARSSRRHHGSFDSDFPVPPFDARHPPSYHSNNFSQRERKENGHSRRHESRSDHDRRRRSKRRSARRRSRDYYSESESYRSDVTNNRSYPDTHRNEKRRQRHRSYSSNSEH